MKYTVKKGDTLESIAEKYLSDPNQWRVLWKVNKDVLRSKNPDLIFPGEVVDIPETKKEPTPANKGANKNDVLLYVNGLVFSGWLDVNISRSIEALSGSFSVGVTERWEKQKEPWPLYEGDKVDVKIDNDYVVSGYIDEIEVGIEKESHSISVKGRDKTADLVDCSVKTGEWKNIKLEMLVKEVCNPYGIQVITEVSTGAPISIKAQPGETVFEMFDRLIKQKGLLITSTRDGKLLITSTGKRKLNITLKEGENILSATVNYNGKDRFSRYVIIGQDTIDGTVGIAKDPSVKRYRQTVITAESRADEPYCKARASWEAIVRAARATSVNILVQGWRDGAGNLWQENAIVNLDIPSLKLKTEMLIVGVEFTKDAESSGSTTSLTLKRKDAFTPQIQLPAGNEP